MENINEQIKKMLFLKQDLNYKDFHSKLMPTINPDTVIGVRVPVLRKLAKELSKEDNIHEFLATLPHDYYEENNIHAFIVEGIKDYKLCVDELNRFLPYVDNWATCDMLRPKVFKKNKDKLINQVDIWLHDDKTYTVRFGIGILLSYFLDDDFKPEYLDKVIALKTDEYYINMMIAWYFATALTKQYETTIKIIERNKLPLWVHNKTIQKANESLKIPKEQKEYLKTLKRTK